MKLEEIVDANERLNYMNWFTQNDTPATDAERLCDFITYLAGKVRLAGPQFLSKEYKSMSKKFGEENFDALLDEMAKLGTQKPFAAKLDMLVDVFNKCCEIKYKKYTCPDNVNEYCYYPNKIVGRVPKKIMNIIETEFDKYQKEDEKTYNKVIKEYSESLKENGKIKPGIVSEREVDDICENLSK